jgi:hypothetical protein
MCDNVKTRLWIASPFIGEWKQIIKILGRKWIDDKNIEFKLITDLNNGGFLNPLSMRHFHKRGEIKSLTGLHAKVYIADDSALITSANLTGTAFSKRYEIGMFVPSDEVKTLQKLYEKWWFDETISSIVTAKDIEVLSKKRSGTRKKGEETNSLGLSTLWDLPDSPGDPYHDLVNDFSDYNKFLLVYNDFVKAYEKAWGRLWPNSPIYFETDSFLNYLFHQAPSKPTYSYREKKPRTLSSAERVREIRKYHAQFRKWIKEGSEGIETEPRRDENSRLIKKLLNKNNISKINRKDVELVVECLNCMNSLPLNKVRFLNSQNNNLLTIKDSWNYLLHGDGPLQHRMTICKSKLKFFGRSSIHELLGFYKPTEYPLRNTNSNAGLRFFGYDVSVY